MLPVVTSPVSFGQKARWQGGGSRMKSGIATKMTSSIVGAVLAERLLETGSHSVQVTIPPGRNYYIHCTGKDHTQLHLKSVLPESRSPAFSLYAMFLLGGGIICPVLQLGILRPGVGACDRVHAV